MTLRRRGESDKESNRSYLEANGNEPNPFSPSIPMPDDPSWGNEDHSNRSDYLNLDFLGPNKMKNAGSWDMTSFKNEDKAPQEDPDSNDDESGEGNSEGNESSSLNDFIRPRKKNLSASLDDFKKLDENGDGEESDEDEDSDGDETRSNGAGSSRRSNGPSIPMPSPSGEGEQEDNEEPEDASSSPSIPMPTPPAPPASNPPESNQTTNESGGVNPMGDPSPETNGDPASSGPSGKTNPSTEDSGNTEDEDPSNGSDDGSDSPYGNSGESSGGSKNSGTSSKPDAEKESDGNTEDGKRKDSQSSKNNDANEKDEKDSGKDGKSKENSKGEEDPPEKRGLVDRAKDAAKNRVNSTVQSVKDAPKNAAKAVKNGAKNRMNAMKDQAIDKLMGPVNQARVMAKQAAETAKRVARKAKELAQKLQRAVKGFMAGVKFLISPPGLISMGVVIAMIVTLGCLQTLGPSIIDCDTSQGSDSSTDKDSSSNGDTASNAELGDFKGEAGKAIWKALVDDLGFSGPGAAGALANAMRESRFDPKARNDKGGVAGLFQWGGYTSDTNSDRIRATGKIKPGDDSTLTIENEIELLKHELNGGFSHVKSLVGKATDPHQAAWDWCDKFEGVNPAKDSQANVAETNAWADQACDAYNCKSVKADESKLGADTGPKIDGDSHSQLSTTVKEMFCGTKDSKGGSGAMNGSINGAKKCEESGCDYSWLCDSMNVCHDGEYGVIPAPYRYQCVWYAWTRAAMVHKGLNSAWSTVMGNGGDIWANAKGRPGWTVDDSPKAGDVVSFSSGGAGHVAFVEKVETSGDGWKIYISEGNFNTGGSGAWNGYNTRWMTKAQVAGNGGHFVRHDSWK